jgi:hypothetical protein
MSPEVNWYWVLQIGLGVLAANLVTLVLVALVLRYRCTLRWHDPRAVFWNAGVTMKGGTECRLCLRRWE